MLILSRLWLFMIHKVRDVSAPGVVEADGDTQFSGLKGQWKDTILVKTNLLPGDFKNNLKNFYRFIIRTRYQRYIGGICFTLSYS